MITHHFFIGASVCVCVCLAKFCGEVVAVVIPSFSRTTHNNGFECVVLIERFACTNSNKQLIHFYAQSSFVSISIESFALSPTQCCLSLIHFILIFIFSIVSFNTYIVRNFYFCCCYCLYRNATIKFRTVTLVVCALCVLLVRLFTVVSNMILTPNRVVSRVFSFYSPSLFRLFHIFVE